MERYNPRMNPYASIFKSLNDAGIQYLIVGGVAVNLHGYRRFTGDIDVLLALDEENLGKMTEIMHQMGFIERLPIELNQLADAEQVKRWIEEKGMTAYTFQSSNELRLGIDVLAGASLDFEKYSNRKVTLHIDDTTTVPVIALEDLLTMKREANRPEDLHDIEMLLHLREL